MAKGKHGHHGGAWKVAYADFVTAMMALFLVLWLTSQDQKIKEAIQRSFTNPFSALTRESTGIIPNNQHQAMRTSGGAFDSASVMELSMLRKLAQDLLSMLKTKQDDPDMEPFRVEMTDDGVRVSIFDHGRSPVFKSESAEFTEYGEWVFSTLAWQIGRFTNALFVELEGHTSPGQAVRSDQYGPWELTADRANSARRELVEHGVQAGQIRKVSGYADTQPMPDRDPDDETNRRVAVMLRVSAPKRF